MQHWCGLKSMQARTAFHLLSANSASADAWDDRCAFRALLASLVQTLLFVAGTIVSLLELLAKQTGMAREA